MQSWKEVSENFLERVRFECLKEGPLQEDHANVEAIATITAALLLLAMPAMHKLFHCADYVSLTWLKVRMQNLLYISLLIS